MRDFHLEIPTLIIFFYETKTNPKKTSLIGKNNRISLTATILKAFHSWKSLPHYHRKRNNEYFRNNVSFKL